jgi:hypothetical protein
MMRVLQKISSDETGPHGHASALASEAGINQTIR